MGDNSIGDVGAADLAPHIAKMSSLQHLSLGGNNIGHRSQLRVSELLVNVHMLTL